MSHVELERSPVYNRYVDGLWEINPYSWLWSPKTKLFLGGNGFGTDTAIDSGPCSRPMAMHGSVSWEQGAGCNYWHFPDDTDGTYLGPTPVTYDNSDFSVAFWYRSTAGDSCVISMGNPGSYKKMVFVLASETYTYRSQMAMGNSSNYEMHQYHSQYLLGNVWRHFAYTRNGAVGKFYVNGVLRSTKSNWTLSGSYVMTVGDTNNYRRINGDIRDVVVGTGDFLTESRIRQLASRRPDLNGAIRSTIPQRLPATTGAPPATNRRRRLLLGAAV